MDTSTTSNIPDPPHGFTGQELAELVNGGYVAWIWRDDTGLARASADEIWTYEIGIECVYDDSLGIMWTSAGDWVKGRVAELRRRERAEAEARIEAMIPPGYTGAMVWFIRWRGLMREMGYDHWCWHGCDGVNDRGEHYDESCIGHLRHIEIVADVGEEQAAYNAGPLLARRTRIDWSAS